MDVFGQPLTKDNYTRCQCQCFCKGSYISDYTPELDGDRFTLICTRYRNLSEEEVQVLPKEDKKLLQQDGAKQDHEVVVGDKVFWEAVRRYGGYTESTWYQRTVSVVMQYTLDSEGKLPLSVGQIHDAIDEHNGQAYFNDHPDRLMPCMLPDGSIQLRTPPEPQTQNEALQERPFWSMHLMAGTLKVPKHAVKKTKKCVIC